MSAGAGRGAAGSAAGPEPRRPVAARDPLEQAAEGLWARLRDVALALGRLESFNFTPERAPGAAGEGAVQELLRDEAGLARAGEELVLRAFRTALDERNYRMLRAVVERDRVGLPELARLVGLPRLSVSERVNDLAQAGLATRVLEEDAAAATPLGAAVLAIVGGIEGRLLARLRERLPGLTGG
jgi:hypothetical protein